MARKIADESSFSHASSPNTMGGAWEENRGRRSSNPHDKRADNPFENGKLYNWSHKHGWDQFYQKNSRHGGAQIGNDHTSNHSGRGPKGYKRSDESIFEDVCETLYLSRDVDASNIEVSIHAGCVRLVGEVESREVKRMAEIEVENISGVVDVQNELVIKRKELYDQKQSEN
jgi:hypothetical protein